MNTDDSDVRRAVESLRSRLSKRGLAISISGIDGSGKTTLARDLVRMLNASGIRARYLHLYQWYWNMFRTPLLLLYNRYLGRRVLVLDRSIYDNIAVGILKLHSPRWLLRMILPAMASIYPRFDYRIYLSTSFDETRLRRPDTCKAHFMALTELYNEIGRRAKYARFRSDRKVFGEVLRHMR